MMKVHDKALGAPYCKFKTQLFGTEIYEKMILNKSELLLVSEWMYNKIRPFMSAIVVCQSVFVVYISATPNLLRSF